MSVTEAAAYVCLTKATLDKYRVLGDGPPYSQAVPRGRVIYRRCDLDAWLCRHRHNSTSEAGSTRKAA